MEAEAVIARTLELDEKATAGPWSWHGEDYRASWGWQVLIDPKGAGLIVGQAADGGPSPHLRAHVPVDPALCLTPRESEGQPLAAAVHVLENDANLIREYRTLAPRLAHMLRETRESFVLVTNVGADALRRAKVAEAKLAQIAGMVSPESPIGQIARASLATVEDGA